MKVLLITIGILLIIFRIIPMFVIWIVEQFLKVIFRNIKNK